MEDISPVNNALGIIKVQFNQCTLLTTSLLRFENNVEQFARGTKVARELYTSFSHIYGRDIFLTVTLKLLAIVWNDRQ